MSTTGKSKTVGGEMLLALLTPEQKAHVAAGVDRTIKALAQHVLVPVAARTQAVIEQAVTLAGQGLAGYVNSPAGQRLLKDLEESQRPIRREPDMAQRLYLARRMDPADLIDLRDRRN
ncbi:hypothetical protein OIE13_06045 [Streptosporangium sp. NBC_01810]|uniref:hypothetical protein n=1 Tax=Streptosporangium sp. NBC_01810 TaxID=2975951 RepID=UPI002DDB511C|nr:hypothetical protein [Streptosporangium sp. NBC_01810]WSA27435.1 hypothetical protein OIE13_06045 [Streptosporangium sp. NBC_01810]